MVYFKDAQQWLQQSTLLLEARPTTTRIVTKYTLAKPIPRSSKAKEPTTTTTPVAAPSSSTSAVPNPSRGHLILRTYDPVSGVCLKYRTDKAAEVGRLIAALGRCGRLMAALPVVSHAEAEKAQKENEGKEEEKGEKMVLDEKAALASSAPASASASAGPQTAPGGKDGAKGGKSGGGGGGGSGGGGGGGGGKKKKKGKK
ncbi:hypothetical protein MMC09_003197 [Bachmanniomyces sp. S44760]|nr:hypothetical protein [Bachmanniomyces sp. S44760]